VKLPIRQSVASSTASRHTGRIAISLVEASEAYDVDVLDGAGQVVRIVSSTSPSTVYSAADQVAVATSTATFAFTGEVAFAAGDRLGVLAPGSQDASLADLSITFLGKRT